MKYQMAMDTASRGYFMSNMLEEAMKLIENLTASDSNRSSDYDRRVNPTWVSDKIIEELNAKVYILMRAEKKSVNLLESDEFNDEEDQTEEINFLGGQGNYQNRGVNPNFRTILTCPTATLMLRILEISFIHLGVLKTNGTSTTMPVTVKWDSILNLEMLVQWI